MLPVHPATSKVAGTSLQTIVMAEVRQSFYSWEPHGGEERAGEMVNPKYLALLQEQDSKGQLYLTAKQLRSSGPMTISSCMNSFHKCYITYPLAGWRIYCMGKTQTSVTLSQKDAEKSNFKCGKICRIFPWFISLRFSFFIHAHE